LKEYKGRQNRVGPRSATASEKLAQEGRTLESLVKPAGDRSGEPEEEG
jgi:hypothetical protein